MTMTTIALVLACVGSCAPVPEVAQDPVDPPELTVEANPSTGVAILTADDDCNVSITPAAGWSLTGIVAPYAGTVCSSSGTEIDWKLATGPNDAGQTIVLTVAGTHTSGATGETAVMVTMAE